VSLSRASVIIRAKDEEAGIGRTLELLHAQTVADEIEIIVVDSGSSDRTVEIARAAGATVVEIPASSFTFGGSLNRGCAHATAPLAVALSAHAFPPDERWLARLIAVFDDEGVACASGDDYGPDGRPLKQRVAQDVALAERNPGWGYSNAAGAFRLDLWRLRAFRPDMPGTEDKEWAWWWLRHGFLHVVDPGLQTVHDHSKDSLRDQYARSKREWTGFGMYLELAPYGIRELLSEWWSDQATYRSPSRARLSHRRAARLLGAYAGRTRSAMRAQERRTESALRQARADPQEGVAIPDPPLRIAVMIDEFPRLSETFVTSEIKELRRLGHQVRVEAIIRSSQPNWPAAAGVDASFVTDEGLPAKMAALLWLVARHPWRCVRDLTSRRAWRREEEVAGLRALAVRARRLHRIRVQHLHAHFALRSALEALRIGRLLDLPYSVTAHAWDIYLEPRNLALKLERAAFATSGCDYTVAHLRTLVSAPAAPRIHRLVMGVDSSRFQRTTPPAGGRTVIGIGRLVEKKGFADLIEAAALLRRDGELERLVIIGDGPLRGELEAQVQRLGLTDLVDMAGARDPDEIRAALERADLLALPCVVAANGDRDSMPVVIKEAMSMELMIVGTNALGLPEMIDTTRGRLVAQHDPGALAAAISELLALPQDRRVAMGHAGRAWVRQHANTAAEAQRLTDLMRGESRGLDAR
jgi:glycosyltransferase involved in cell wall biosynthesis